MKRINRKTLGLTSGPFLAIAVLSFLYYERVPDRVATHFSINGQPDQMSSKFVALVILPLGLYLLHLVVCLASDLQGKGQVPVIRVAKWILPLIGLCAHASIISYALTGQVDIRRIVVAMLGLVYLVMGNYMPKSIPGQPSDAGEDSFRRRLAYVFTASGFGLLVSLAGPPLISVFVLGLFLGVLVLVLAQYFFHRRKKRSIR